VIKDNESSDDEDNEIINLCMTSAAMSRQIALSLYEEIEDDEDDSEAEWGVVSRPGRARDFVSSYQRLMQNYFNGPRSKYNEEDFKH
jgi:hypothetical protein